MKNNKVNKRKKVFLVAIVTAILLYSMSQIAIVKNTNIYAKEIENLAKSAKVAVPEDIMDSVASLEQVNDGNMNTEMARKTDDSVSKRYVGDDYIQFDWDKAVNVNKVTLSSWYCYGQAPLSWKITVYDELAKQWKEVAIVEDADWTSEDGIQSKSLVFPMQKDVKALRVNIIKNNNRWSKYVIKEIEIFMDESTVYADANGDGSVNLKDFVRMTKYVNGYVDNISTDTSDIYKDGSVDTQDIKSLEEYLLGKESMVPYKKGYVLDWSEEFDEVTLDTNKWLPQYFPHATYNDKLAAAKYELKDGVFSLVLDETTKSFTAGNDSGMKVSSIQTYEKDYLHNAAPQAREHEIGTYNGYTTKYGYFEMRCKAPSCGGGGAYAWWLTGIQDDETVEYGADGSVVRKTKHNAEIDIIENLFSRPNFMRFNVIRWNDDALDLTDYAHLRQEIEGDFVNEWHVYAFDWTPEHMDFYVDGVLQKHVATSIQYEMCMYVSMYMVTDPESVPNYTWGYANDVFPKKWDIDYIRVYKKAE